jgi:glycosyltransferase involved in cell wall biosynthesis
MTTPPFLSIIIPVYNGGSQFERCLQAVQRSTFTDWELIVVDDGSTDGSTLLARRFGAKLFETGGREGPAVARNLGARLAKGEYLYFIDADCELHPDTLAVIAVHFQANPTLDALFGSYDDAPGAANFTAQYKNLFHHYVHQNSQEEASTFWTGCGAIKRRLFLALGGFDVQRYRRPSIEVIDLGYRLKQNGGRIHLVKQVQVKHLKAWTLTSLLKSDIFDRGIPWTRLILRDRSFAADLNLQTHNRVSVVAVYVLLLSLLASFLQPILLLLVLGLAGLLIWLNLRLYQFFYQKRGLVFALRVIPMHWLYYIYNGLAFGCGLCLHWRDQLKTETISTPTPLGEGIEPDRN